MKLACPSCGESERLEGHDVDTGIEVECRTCGFAWVRDPSPACARCGLRDLFSAVAAIVEKGRGTQLSIVGSRVIHLCEECDAATIAYYLRTRPNPLMPDQLPNSPGEEG